VRVTHQGNGRSVEVVINDRGPYIAGRIIDLSKAAASVIGMTGQGIARVAVEVLGR
jgi:rare lipoprotein A